MFVLFQVNSKQMRGTVAGVSKQEFAVHCPAGSVSEQELTRSQVRRYYLIVDDQLYPVTDPAIHGPIGKGFLTGVTAASSRLKQ